MRRLGSRLESILDSKLLFIYSLPSRACFCRGRHGQFRCCRYCIHTTLQTERASTRRLRRQPLISPESCSDTHFPLAAGLVAARVAYYPCLRHAVCHGHSRVIVENVLGIASWKSTPLTAQDRFTPPGNLGLVLCLGGSPPRKERASNYSRLTTACLEADSARSSWSTVATQHHPITEATAGRGDPFVQLHPATNLACLSAFCLPVCLLPACLPASRYVGRLDTGHWTLDIQPGAERSGHSNTPTTSNTPSITPPTSTVSLPKASPRLREHSPLPSPAPAPQRQTFPDKTAGSLLALHLLSLSPACRYGSNLANHPSFPCRVVCTPNGGPLSPACPAICLALDRSALRVYPLAMLSMAVVGGDVEERGPFPIAGSRTPCMHTTMHQGCLFWPGIWCPRDPVDIGFREGLC